jgi:heme/copper-type cytochrome/quinol oxidase subunit 4
MSQDIVTLITVLAVAVVAVILFMGLWNMLRGGDANRSQMLMRARVIAQFVALVVLLGALYFFGQGHHS